MSKDKNAQTEHEKEYALKSDIDEIKAILSKHRDTSLQDGKDKIHHVREDLKGLAYQAGETMRARCH